LWFRRDEAVPAGRTVRGSVVTDPLTAGTGDASFVAEIEGDDDGDGDRKAIERAPPYLQVGSNEYQQGSKGPLN